MSTNFYIASELGSDLVMDVEGGSSIDGAAIIINKKTTPAANSQLWHKQPAGQGEADFYLVTQLGGTFSFISVQGNKAVLSSSGSVFNQQDLGGHMFYLADKQSNELLTVQGSSTVPGTRIVAAAKNPDAESQKWEKKKA